MELLIAVGIGAVALVIIVVGILVILAKFRVVPEADQAVVVTGSTTKEKTEEGTKQKPKVVVGGGTFVIPIFNKHKLIPLEVVQIPISWKAGSANAALPSKDRIPVELEGELSVHVDGNNEDQIILASQKLGIPNQTAGLLQRGEKKFSMKDAVKQKADKLVQAALRTAVFEFEFVELNADKEKFEERVQLLLQKDLARFGLTLTAVSIPHVSQGEFGGTEGDMFDAEGQRKVSEIVEKARTETNDIEKTNEIARQKRDLSAREQELTLDYEKAQKEADQARQVAEYEAQQAAATKQEVLTQEQAVAEKEAAQARAIKEAQIEEARKVEEAEISKAKEVAIAQAKADALKVAEEAAKREAEEEAQRREQEAEIKKNKAVEAAKIEKEQAIKVADEKRQQAIEEAEVERQEAVALRRAEEAVARAEQARKEAEQKDAEEAIVTVKEKAEADRARQVVVIKAEEDAQREKIDADKAAYVEAKKAEGERDAKRHLAEAEVAESKGHADAKKAVAQGDADAIEIEANAYAMNIKTRAEADFEAADQQAEAKKKLAEALLEEGKAQAEARRLAVEAENALDNRLIFQAVALAAIERAPEVVHEIMAPVANVAHDVKILQVSGMGENGEGEAIGGLPQTILQTGLAAAGIKPFLGEALKAVSEDPEVKQAADLVGGVVRGALKDAVGGIKDGLSDTDNGAGSAVAVSEDQ